MDRQHIENAAVRLDRALEDSNMDGFQKQLNALKPCDQLAVVKELQKIAEKHHDKDANLPTVDFTECTNAKGKAVLAEVTTVKDRHNKYDDSTDHETAKLTIDNATGKIQALTRHEDSGVFQRDESTTYDSKGRILVEDVQFSGAHFHNEREYDAKTGKVVHELSSTGQVGAEPMTVDKNYDPVTGKRVSTDVHFPSGTNMHFDISHTATAARAVKTH